MMSGWRGSWRGFGPLKKEGLNGEGAECAKESAETNANEFGKAVFESFFEHGPRGFLKGFFKEVKPFCGGFVAADVGAAFFSLADVAFVEHVVEGVVVFCVTFDEVSWCALFDEDDEFCGFQVDLAGAKEGVQGCFEHGWNEAWSLV